MQSYSYHRDDEDNLFYQDTNWPRHQQGGLDSGIPQPGDQGRDRISIHIADLHRMTADLHSRAPVAPDPVKSVHATLHLLDSQ